MSARSGIRPVKYKAPTIEKASQNVLSVTPAAVNSVYYAALIWVAFIITCLTLILPHFINQRHFWTVLELLSARRWFDVAYNALHARPLAVEDKAKEGDAAQSTSVKPVLFQRILNKLGLLSNQAPYTMPVAAEESMLNFYGDTGYVQIPDIEDKEKFGMDKDDPSGNQHLWYLMERPDIQDQLMENPFKQLTSLTFSDQSPIEDSNRELSFAQQVEEMIQNVNEIQERLAVVVEEEEEEIREPSVAQGKPLIHSPLVCQAGSCQYHASLDPTKLNDPKYFSAGVERLIKEMLQDVALSAAQDTYEQESEVAKTVPVSVPEVVSLIPELTSEKFAAPVEPPVAAAGDQAPLTESILPSAEPAKINTQFSSTGISEPLPVSSFRLSVTPTDVMSEVIVRPSQQRLSHLPEAVVLPCDIDLTKPNGWRLAQWTPCEIRISADDIVIRYRNRKDQLVEKRISEKDPTKFTFSVPRSLKTGISASARRFGLVCPKGHFRFRAPDHESQAKIMRAIQNFTRPVTV